MAHGVNTNPIPGEQRSVATDGVAVSADGVKDYLKNKFQEQINKEVDTEIEQIKGGSEGSIASLQREINDIKGGSGDSIASLKASIIAEEQRAEGVEATKANASDVYTREQGTALEDSVAQSISQQNTNINTKFAEQNAQLDNQDDKLDNIQATVNAKQLEIGAVETDLEPTKNSPNILTSGSLYDAYGGYEENDEYIYVKTDAEGKLLLGIRKDGDIQFGIGIPYKIKEEIEKFYNLIKETAGEYIDNDEYIKVLVDNENKVLEGYTKDGVKFFNTPIEIDCAKIYGIENSDNLVEMLLDGEGKPISYRRKNGVKVENAGIETPSLKLTGNGLNDLEQALRDNGFRSGGCGDWSDYISNDGDDPLSLPEPKLAFVNIITDFDLTQLNKEGLSGSVKGVNFDIPTEVEFWDNQGNYFKKWTLMSGQGSSSMGYAKKNIAFDFFDKEADGDAFKIQFGDWVPQDSFHLKAYVADFFKCLSPVCYQIADEVAKTRGVMEDVQWKRALYADYHFTGNLYTDSQIDDISLQMDNGAKCQPDGFPCIVFQNGEFYGIYAFLIKKHRDNYHISKKSAKNIHLDGQYYDHHLFNGDIAWNMFEVRNPKDLYYKEAHPDFYTGEPTYKYDADNPGKFEIADQETIDAWTQAGTLPDGKPLDAKIASNTAKVHKSITDLSGRLAEIEAASTIEAKKVLIEKYFDVASLIDYELIQCAVVDPDSIFNNVQWVTWDGKKWFACEYDKDDTFGNHLYCNMPRTEGSWTYALFYNNDVANGSPIGLVRKYYQREAALRWKELVDAGIFTPQHFMTLVRQWMARIGKDFYEKEYTKWSNSESNRGTNINTDYWKYVTNEYNTSVPSYDNTKSYAAGEKCSVPASLGYSHVLECVSPCTGEDPFTGEINGWRGNIGQLDAFIRNNFEKENAFFENIINS